MDERILASPLAHALARSLNLCDHDNSNIIACCICLEGLLDLIRRGFCTRHARLLVSITRQTQLQLNRRQRARAHGLLGVTTRKLEFFDASTSPMPASRNPVTVSSSPIRHMSLSAFMANAGAAIALPQVHHNIVTGSLIEVQTFLTPASQDGRESSGPNLVWTTSQACALDETACGRFLPAPARKHCPAEPDTTTPKLVLYASRKLDTLFLQGHARGTSRAATRRQPGSPLPSMRPLSRSHGDEAAMDRRTASYLVLLGHPRPNGLPGSFGAMSTACVIALPAQVLAQASSIGLNTGAALG